MISDKPVMVPLEDYFNRELPIKLPQLRRKNIIRLRGVVECLEDTESKKWRLFSLEKVEKVFACTNLARPAIGDTVEVIATEGAAWHFVKHWKKIELSTYRLRSNVDMENEALNILATSLDERISADDLHTPEMMTLLAENKRDPRVLGSILGSLVKQDIIKPIGRIRSTRRTCHHRPDLKVWTWNTPVSSGGD